MKSIILVIIALIICTAHAIKDKSKLLHIEVEKRNIDLASSSRPADEKFLQFGGQPSANIELDNINNQQYVGYIYMGTPPQKMKVLFDTGSPLMYIVTEKCANCPKSMDKFDSKKSKSFNQLDKQEKQYFGSGQIEGHVAQDSVCFTKESFSCIENTQFIAVEKAKDIDKDQFSGLIGLSPLKLDSSSVPAFITQGEQVFSFYLSKDSNQKGSIVMGGYDLDQYAQLNSTENDIQWIELAEDAWSLPLNGLKFINSSDDIPLKSSLMQLDTGLSYSMVPQEDITNIETALKKQNIECTEEHSGMGLDLYQCSCSDEDYEKLTPFEIKTGSKALQVPVSSFLRQKGDGKCTLLMYPNDDNSLTVDQKWIVGDTFLQNFYSIFNWEQKKVGLVAPKKTPGVDDVPKKTPPKDKDSMDTSDNIEINVQDDSLTI